MALKKISVYCTECRAEIHATAAQIGRQVRCSHCGKITLLAEAQPVPDEDEDQTGEEPSGTPDDDTAATGIGNTASRRRNTRVEELDMTPMVDVTFLLLIFFMVTASFALQRSLEIPPQQKEDDAAQKQVIDKIDENNSVILRIRKDNTVWVEDKQIPSRQELLAVLRDFAHPGNETPAVNTLTVYADGMSKHETVIMALDSGNAVGMKNIQLIMEDQE